MFGRQTQDRSPVAHWVEKRGHPTLGPKPSTSQRAPGQTGAIEHRNRDKKASKPQTSKTHKTLNLNPRTLRRAQLPRIGRPAVLLDLAAAPTRCSHDSAVVAIRVVTTDLAVRADRQAAGTAYSVGASMALGAPGSRAKSLNPKPPATRGCTPTSPGRTPGRPGSSCPRRTHHQRSAATGHHK
jgi:hypothetical protein